MKRKLLTVFMALFCALGISAQTPTLPAQCKAWLPKAMDETILMEQEIKRVMALPDFGMSEKATNKYWVVCSDRVDNPTYVAPQSGAAQYMTLGFNQMLTIAEVSNGYALVYSDPIKESSYPMISPKAECYGWVPMSHLLLWRSCLYNEHGSPQKALLCVNLDKSSSDSANLGSGSFDPYGKTKFALKSDMNFYYVVKRENKMTLLALQGQFVGVPSGQVLFCWVPDNLFVPWNHRLCLEPTWDKNDVEYFHARGIKIPIYKNELMAKGGDPISRIEFHKKNEKGRKSLYMYRMNGEYLRFPILENSSDSVYHILSYTTFMADEMAKQEETSMAENTMIEHKKSPVLGCFNAYVPKKDKSGRNFFKPVVFMSREEYLVLMQCLTPVYQAAIEQSPDRTSYIEAMKALERSLAPGITDAEIWRSSNSEIVPMASGWPPEMEKSRKKYTIEDLADPRVISDEEFHYIIKNVFVMKYRALEKVGQKGYEFKKTFNDAIYYWIPLEIIP